MKIERNEKEFGFLTVRVQSVNVNKQTFFAGGQNWSAPFADWSLIKPEAVVSGIFSRTILGEFGTVSKLIVQSQDSEGKAKPSDL